ncbi:MAG: UbiD family decarboxylase [Anaerolineaceae bacterium]|nr:UbiD family decarboxylase [Anaerolineaceae bacterium]
MATIKDLRSFIEVLKEKGSFEKVSQPVSLEHELANIGAALARQGGKAVLFEHVTRAEDTIHWPIFTNGVVSPATAAVALECAPNEVVNIIGAALEPANAVPARKSDKEAPWKQNVITGDDINLYRLPIPTHGALDGGPFITGGVTVSRDPVSGRGNLSYNRMQILGPHTFGFNVNEWRHTMQFYKGQEKKDEPLKLAIAIGLDPAIMIAAGARYDNDELLIAGAIRGEPVLVDKGVTVDVDIPFHAEVVIEGYLPPHTRHAEGPLAEFHGYYGELWNSPTFEVTAICYRNDPIFQTIVPGWAEHVYIGNVLPREPLLLRFCRHVSKDVKALHIPPYANGFAAIVQLEKSNPGEPKNVALAALTAHVNVAKVVVVDPDVNIYDPADVLWAMTNRVEPTQDVFYIKGAQGHEMDPTADMRGVQTKVGIDATYKPERRDYGERIRYPEIDLSKYLSS